MSDRPKRKWDDPEEQAKPVVLDPAAQAAAIAAKIAATMGGSRPPPRDDSKDGAFTFDIEINDLRNRYLLTKGSTQAQIGGDTGASIVTKGIWLPDKSKATAQDPPLYLHIAASSQEMLDKAVGMVNDLINQELGPLVEDRSQYARNREKYLAESSAPRERKKWPEEKIVIGLESLRNFNVRAKVVGPGGMFVKFIQAETGTRVQIKGLGSGFYENETGRESEEPMHINVTGPDEAMISRAKELAEDLLDVVKQEYEKARQAAFGGGGGGGYHQQGGGAGGYNAAQQAYAYQQQQLQQQQGQGGYAGYPGYGTDGQTPVAGSNPAATPAGTAGTPATGDVSGATGATTTTTTTTGAAPAAGSADYGAAYEQYRQYWAQYGYNVDDPAFQQWQASQQYGQQQQPTTATTTATTTTTTPAVPAAAAAAPTTTGGGSVTSGGGGE